MFAPNPEWPQATLRAKLNSAVLYTYPAALRANRESIKTGRELPKTTILAAVDRAKASISHRSNKHYGFKKYVGKGDVQQSI